MALRFVILVSILAEQGWGQECPFESDDAGALHLLQKRASALTREDVWNGSVPIGCRDAFMQDQLQREFFINVSFKAGAVMETRQLLLDSGSDNVAFCPGTVPLSQVDAVPAGFVSCNSYGQLDHPSGYAGYMYQGDTYLGALTLRNRYFSVMKYESQMPCMAGYQGIYGIGPVQGKLAYNSGGFSDVTDLKSALAWCKHNATLAGYAATAQVKEFREAPIGVFWSGLVGMNVGNLYFGASARQNPHYSSGAVLKTPLNSHGGHWILHVTKFVVGGTAFEADPNVLAPGLGFNCAIDTGSSETTVPPAAYDALQVSGHLEFHLKNADGGKDVVLTLGDKEEDTPELYLKKLEKGLPYILGKLLFIHYYVVADVAGKTAELVAKEGAWRS